MTAGGKRKNRANTGAAGSEPQDDYRRGCAAGGGRVDCSGAGAEKNPAAFGLAGAAGGGGSASGMRPTAAAFGLASATGRGSAGRCQWREGGQAEERTQTRSHNAAHPAPEYVPFQHPLREYIMGPAKDL